MCEREGNNRLATVAFKAALVRARENFVPHQPPRPVPPHPASRRTGEVVKGNVCNGHTRNDYLTGSTAHVGRTLVAHCRSTPSPLIAKVGFPDSIIRSSTFTANRSQEPFFFQLLITRIPSKPHHKSLITVYLTPNQQATTPTIYNATANPITPATMAPPTFHISRPAALAAIVVGVGWPVVEVELVVLAALILFVAVVAESEVVVVESSVAIPVAPPTKVKSSLFLVVAVAAGVLSLLLLLLLSSVEEDPFSQNPSAVHVVPFGQQPPPRSLAHL
jgi:hypothetical protein